MAYQELVLKVRLCTLEKEKSTLTRSSFSFIRSAQGFCRPRQLNVKGYRMQCLWRGPWGLVELVPRTVVGAHLSALLWLLLTDRRVRITVCVYKQVGLITDWGCMCTGWASAKRNQEETRAKSWSHCVQMKWSAQLCSCRQASVTVILLTSSIYFCNSTSCFSQFQKALANRNTIIMNIYTSIQYILLTTWNRSI